MGILVTSGKTVLRYPFSHDADEENYYNFVWRPRTRENSKEYLLNDVVIPSSANGLYYLCVSPGISGSSEPIMGTELDGVTTDGTGLQWLAQAYSFMLNTGDSITNSVWSSDTGVVIVNDDLTTTETWCQVTTVPTDITEFILTNSVTILRASGRTDKKDRSILIQIREL